MSLDTTKSVAEELRHFIDQNPGIFLEGCSEAQVNEPDIQESMVSFMTTYNGENFEIQVLPAN